MTLDNAPKHWICGELLTAAMLATPTQHVSMPLTHLTPYDLILDVEHRLYRVQVKWAQFVAQRIRRLGKGDRAHYQVGFVRRSGKKERKISQEFDLLAIVCTPTLIYFVPRQRLLKPDGQLPRQIRLKPEDLTRTRADSAAATSRWAPYCNNVETALREIVTAAQ